MYTSYMWRLCNTPSVWLPIRLWLMVLIEKSVLAKHEYG